MAVVDERREELRYEHRWALPEDADEDLSDGEDSTTAQGIVSGLPNPQYTQSLEPKNKWYEGPRVTETPLKGPWASELAQEQSTLLTSTYIDDGAYQPTSTNQPGSSGATSVPTATDSGAAGATRIPPLEGSKPGGFNGLNGGRAVVAAMIVGCIVVLVAILVGFGCLARKLISKERRPRETGASRAEMRQSGTFRSFGTRAFRLERSSLLTPLPTAQPMPGGGLATSGIMPTAAQPVILGPITAGYYTGLDTQSISSARAGSGLADPFADGHGVGSETPPLYQAQRPPSYRTDATPSVVMSDGGSGMGTSRQSSLRGTRAAEFRMGLHSSDEDGVDIGQSPFAHPDDDDAVSELSASGLERSQDNMSVVSELSYQEEPVVARRQV